MAKERALPPIWLMGMGFIPLGVSGGIALYTTPTLLAAQHVPEAAIAGVTSLALVPGFATFVLAPLIDWRFSRRTYAIASTLITGVCQFTALLFLHNLAWLSWVLFVGMIGSAMATTAVGGWFSNLTSTEGKSGLGAWFTVANIGFGGLTTMIAVPLLRDLPFVVGDAILSAMVLLPIPLFLWIPCPPADYKLAHESFGAFARDIVKLLRKPSVLWTLPLFLAPSASFALTNTLSGFGRDFATSDRLIGVLTGIGSATAGVFGSLVVPKLAQRINPRPLYLLVGGVGAVFTLIMLLLPRDSTTFGLAVLGENGFQAAAFTVCNIITLRTIGQDNPLAATQFGLLIAASQLPLIYMQEIDGHAYGFGGVSGTFIADAAVSGVACALLGLGLWLWRRRIPAI